MNKIDLYRKLAAEFGTGLSVAIVMDSSLIFALAVAAAHFGRLALRHAVHLSGEGQLTI